MTLQTEHHPAWAGPPRVRLEPIPHHHMILDGGWWPHSRDPGVELPGLVPALDGIRGPVVRLLLSAAGWTRRPHHVVVADRTVSIGYFSDKPPTMLTAICADGGVLTLLVVPAQSGGRGQSPDALSGEPRRSGGEEVG